MDNIIAVKNVRTKELDTAFGSFMHTFEGVLNDGARVSPNEYRKLNGYLMEGKALDVLREIAPSTPFSANDIVLVSGHKFPDIVASHYYGVEVKTTKSDSWRSTGSSIVETTRVEGVESIYLLFGKLGGTMPEFKCKPYECCLSDIAVTHSPRYLIDMELGDGDTIFDRMEIPYDVLRNDPQSIDKVRDYYRQRAQKKHVHEMPWWLGSQREELSVSPTLKLWSEQERSMKARLQAEMAILFSEEIVAGYYGTAVMWLCSKHSIVDHCFRDMWSAGGRFNTLVNPENGQRTQLDWTIPKIVGKMLEIKSGIDEVKANPQDIELEILEYNEKLSIGDKSWYDRWLNGLNNIFNSVEVQRGKAKALFGEIYGESTFKKWFTKGFRLDRSK